jgi:hypothetical protein
LFAAGRATVVVPWTVEVAAVVVGVVAGSAATVGGGTANGRSAPT